MRSVCISVRVSVTLSLSVSDSVRVRARVCLSVNSRSVSECVGDSTKHERVGWVRVMLRVLVLVMFGGWEYYLGVGSII